MRRRYPFVVEKFNMLKASNGELNAKNGGGWFLIYLRIINQLMSYSAYNR